MHAGYPPQQAEAIVHVANKTRPGSTLYPWCAVTQFWFVVPFLAAVAHQSPYGIPKFDNKGGSHSFLKVYENVKLAYTVHRTVVSGVSVCVLAEGGLMILLCGCSRSMMQCALLYVDIGDIH